MEKVRCKVQASCPIEEVNSFKLLPIKSEILQRMVELSIDVKTAHRYALKFMIKREKSLLLVSPPASGRGSASMIAILNSIDYTRLVPQALILCPTKLLAKEYFETINSYARYLPLKSELCIGLRFVEKRNLVNSQVIVGTCGKLKYFLSQNLLHLSYVRIIVCDIANKLFSPINCEETEELLNQIAINCIYWYLSPKIQNNLKEKFLAKVLKGETIIVERDEKALEEVTFYAKICEEVKEKDDFVLGVSYHSNKQVIIFSRCLDELEKYEDLMKNFSAVLILSRFSQQHKKAILQDFTSQVIKILICESKGSVLRKIQSKNPVDVLNLDLPKNNDEFLMRIRRFDYSPEDCIYIVTSSESYQNIQFLAQNLSLKIVLY
ncbi:hypothetical protein SteCoe_30617 [Stentor coeruleus]|uniref:ATP-dependent RNA helicase n=1 Tax=Stentor coeruleus TaxID=5963 RepID=A0A1R2B3M7_9CILI|nr:hypothetical protein SteCoe_30617 [Stentor coeruleus]